MARSETERLAEKTVERQFLHELEVDFELAPATSRALLSAAQQVLLSCACPFCLFHPPPDLISSTNSDPQISSTTGAA